MVAHENASAWTGWASCQPALRTTYTWLIPSNTVLSLVCCHDVGQLDINSTTGLLKLFKPSSMAGHLCMQNMLWSWDWTAEAILHVYKST
mmetsp:Transcript_31093/g.92577  ORF Transcript_31093/g.92577 Transcript_31093/m.92577 type:complete len:90 (-) Transcript_31093:579-848(-)